MSNWFTKRSIGIDISDHSIEVVELNRHRDILAYGRVILEEDIVRNGQILKKEQLAVKLKEILVSAKPESLYPYPTGYGLKTVISLPEPKVLIHFFNLRLIKGESSDEQQLINLVKAEAERVIPVNLENLYWDYLEVSTSSEFKPYEISVEKKVLKPVKDNNSNETRGYTYKSVLFAAAPKELVNDYLEVLKMVEIQPAILDIESAAQGRVLLKGLLPNTTSTATLKFWANRTAIRGKFSEPREARASVKNFPGFREELKRRVRRSLAYVSHIRLPNVSRGSLKSFEFRNEGAFGNSSLKPLPRDNASLILDLGGRATNISIFNKDGLLALSVSVGVGGNHLTKLIAGELKTSDSAVENLKRKFGFDDLKNDNRILPILKVGFKKIIKELQNSIFHYENTYRERVGRIILTGGSSLMPKVDEYTGLNVKRKVILGNPLEALRDAELFKRGNLPPVLFSTAIGLALRGITDRPDGLNLFRSVDTQEGKNTMSLITEKFLVFWSKIKKLRKKVLVVIFVIAAFVALGIIVNQYIFRAKIEIVPSDVEFRGGEKKTEVRGENKENGSVAIPLPPVTATGKTSPAPEKKIVIKDTPTGWLNVREGPGTGYKVLIKVYPTQQYVFLEEKGGWFKINVDGKVVGWVTSQYAQKLAE